jgi:2-(1,2-epoxy-1,2-dihydrophenyl)acetyl-CoA isomerase
MVTGGSLGLLLGADIVLMTPEATITPWYSAVGFSPDGGWTAILPHLIGRRRVSQILFTNSTVTATEAAAWGIAAEVVEAPEIRERALSVAHEIAAQKTEAVRSAKTLLTTGTDEVEGRLDEERRAFVAQVTTPEAMKGMAAFLRRSH